MLGGWVPHFFENLGVTRLSGSRWFRQLDSWNILLKKVLPMVVLLSNKGSIFEKDTKNIIRKTFQPQNHHELFVVPVSAMTIVYLSAMPWYCAAKQCVFKHWPNDNSVEKNSRPKSSEETPARLSCLRKYSLDETTQRWCDSPTENHQKYELLVVWNWRLLQCFYLQSRE